MARHQRPLAIDNLALYTSVYLVLLGATYVTLPMPGQPPATTVIGPGYVLLGLALAWHAIDVLVGRLGSLVRGTAALTVGWTALALIRGGSVGVGVAHALLGGVLLATTLDDRVSPARRWVPLGVALGGGQILLGLEAVARDTLPALRWGAQVVVPSAAIGLAYLLTGAGVLTVSFGRWATRSSRHAAHLSAGCVLAAHWTWMAVQASPALLLAVPATCWRTLALTALPAWERRLELAETRTLRALVAVSVATISVVGWLVPTTAMLTRQPASISTERLVVFWVLPALMLLGAYVGAHFAQRFSVALRRALQPDHALADSYGVAEIDEVSRTVTAHVSRIEELERRKAAEETLLTRHRQLGFLARTAQRLLLTSAPDRPLLESIFRELGELIGYEAFYHYRVNTGLRTMRLAAHGGISDQEEGVFATMRIGAPPCGLVAERRESLLFEDLQDTARPGSEALRAAGLASYVGFPIITHEQLVGTVAFVSRARTHLREGDLPVVQATCDQIATAFERAGLVAQVRENEEHLRRVIEAMHIFVGVLTPDGIMVECNVAPVRAAGLQREQVIGVHFADSYWWGYSDESRARIRADIDRALSGEAVRYDAPVRVRGTDGEPTFIDVDFALTPLRDSTGAVTHLIPIGIDISARTRAEAALRDADRQKDEFIAVLAHELRNPLAPIRTSIAILKARGPADPALVKCRGIIDRQISHMARLLDDLLDVSRLSRGRFTLQRAAVRLQSIISEAAEAAQSVIDDRGHKLTVEPIDPAIVLDADGARLTQIFTNLLNNAAKYTDRGGSITVTTTRSETEVAVHVRDSGIGLAADMRERIFDLFTQVEDARARSEGGLGIGLGLTKRLVEMHGGQIVADSPGPGQGSTFTVTLPLRAGVAAAPEPGPTNGGARAALPQRRRVLVVDDHVDAADTMGMLLQELGCDTRIAYDGATALLEAQRFQPDLVLLDLGMPGLDGQTVCRRLRAEAWGVNMVVAAVTGWGPSEDRRHTRVAGFDFHLVKPVEPETLERMVRELPQPQGS